MAKSEAEQAVDEGGTQDSSAGTGAAVAASNGAQTSAGAALAGAGPIRPSPAPSGAVRFGELTSAFVDGPRLLRFLGDGKHTGAVIDKGPDGEQVALLYEGGVVALIASSARSSSRLDHLSLAGPGEQNEHDLRVITYRPEVVLALAQLVNVPERYERMHGSFVDLPALLSFLRREKANGAVRVTTGGDVGVILVRNGEVLGAYTREKRDLDDADVVLGLGKASDAEIDVHTGPLTLPPATAPVSSVV